MTTKTSVQAFHSCRRPPDHSCNKREKCERNGRTQLIEIHCLLCLSTPFLWGLCWSPTALLTMTKHGAEQVKVQVKRERGQLDEKVWLNCVLSVRAVQGERKYKLQRSEEVLTPAERFEWPTRAHAAVGGAGRRGCASYRQVIGVGKPVVLSLSVLILRRTHSL